MSETYTYRNIENILNEVMEYIPEEETALLEDLNNFKKGLCYKAPELRNSCICWLPFQNILNFHITSFEEEWKVKIKKIFNDDTDKI